MRGVRQLIVILCGSLSFGSCTCYRQAPEPAHEVTTAKRGGFGALATRVPQKPVVEQRERVERIEPTQQPALSTPLAEVAVPEDFPTDLPLFKGSKPFAVQDLAGNAHNVLFNVEAAPGEIFRHYQDEMQREGWGVTQQYQSEHQSFLSFKKGDMITNMTISKNPRTGQQVVGIMYQKEEPLPFPEF